MSKNKDVGEEREDRRDPRRRRNPGLPNPATVVSERMFTSPKGRRYRIIKTNEKDPYDPPNDEDKDAG
jgi:hypothetical protein